MGKEKNGFAGMLTEMIEDVLVKMAARDCMNHAKVKVTLDASSDGKQGSVDLHYEGNSLWYIYGAYVLIEEAVKESGINIDFFLNVIKIIEEHSTQKRSDTNEGERRGSCMNGSVTSSGRQDLSMTGSSSASASKRR